MAKEGKKFGLIIPKSKQNLVVGSRLKPSFFDEDDELDDNKKEKKEKQSVGADTVKRHVQNQLKKALEEDSTVFQYDEVYNKLEDERNKVVETKKAKEKREPKYVANLLKTAEKRQQEYDAREERKQMSEREKEAGEFDDREVFVTGAYRKKMEELQKYKEDERKREQLESMMDVTKQKDMTGFYKHFLNDMTAGKSDIPTVAKVSNEKLDADGKNDEEPSADQLKAKKQKTFRLRERRMSSDNDDDDRHVEQRSPRKSSTSKRRRSKSSSSDEERRAFEEFESKHSKKHSSRSNARVETEIQKNRRFFTPSPSPERTSLSDRHRKSDEKSHRIDDDDRHNKQSRSVDKSSKKRPESSQNRKKYDELKNEPETKEKVPETVIVEKKFISEKEEKENKLKERLAKMKILFARRNDETSINEYRQRYFERKAARKNA